MPLQQGSSRKAVAANIAELMAAHARKGRIGNSPPEGRKKAQKRAVAIALSKQRQALAAGR